MRIVVLISGNGSNLQALFDAPDLGGEIVGVVSNRKAAYGLQRAAQAGIPTATVSIKRIRDAGGSREDFDAHVAEVVGQFQPDLVVLAGWMHILSTAFLRHFPGRVLNLHPALPGQFPGLDGMKRAYLAWQAGEVAHSGVMVHRVVPEVDAGPVVADAIVPILPNDSFEDFKARMHATEHRLIVQAVRSEAVRLENKVTRRAILSVWDKAGLVELGTGLVARGFELVASGGTSRMLREAGLDVLDVSDVTGHPEILGGRVKTLHPAVHGGILSRRTEAHLQELAEHNIGAVDMVVCNLYPFEATVAQPGVTDLECIEQIDIGGVTLLRAAAKNHEAVAIVSDPADYSDVLEAIDTDGLNEAFRRKLAIKAFRMTAAYDIAISNWMATAEELPEQILMMAERTQTLRYGENPHQAAALYTWRGQVPAFEQIQGKAISYNNLVDLHAAWAMPQEFETPAVAIIKHTNPSGLATHEDVVEAFKRALACDPVSAFGSIIAVNRVVDVDLLDAIGKLFVEVIAAPDFTPAALEWLGRRKKNCRVMKHVPGKHALDAVAARTVTGGMLVQSRDTTGVDTDKWKIVSDRQPTQAELDDLAFAWLAAKHVKSNAIVFAKGRATVGVGAGQMNRVDSVRLAAWRAGEERSQGSVLASDAFFPFPDGIEAAAEAGVTAVIQPGGSIRDDLVIEAVNKLGLAMVFTGERHFLH